MAKHSLTAQIAEVKAEISARKIAYPSGVARGKIRASEAEMKIDLMLSVVATLEFMQANEDTIREAIRAKRDAAIVGADLAVCAECGQAREHAVHDGDSAMDHNFRARV